MRDMDQARHAFLVHQSSTSDGRANAWSHAPCSLALFHLATPPVAPTDNALAEVRTLRGIVPICANCHNIRDDEGFWHRVEVYVHDHTHADFSHGICPPCVRKLYPDRADEIFRGLEEKTRSGDSVKS